MLVMAKLVGQSPGQMAQDPMKRAEEKLEYLERMEIGVRQDVAHTHQAQERMTQDLHQELQQLKEELVLVDVEMRKVMTKVRGTLEQFKTAVKKGDLARLQAKADMWAPEKRITKKQFEKMIDSQ